MLISVGSNSLVLQEVAVSLSEILQEGGLFVDGRKKPVLMWSEFFKLCLEKLVFVIPQRH